MAKPDEETPETEAQPTAAARGSSGSGGASKATATTTEAAPEEETVEALPPTENEDGTAFTPQWLIDNSEAVLGYPSHVASGALASSEEEFLTPDQAKAAIDAWLETPVVTDTGEEG